GFLPRSAFPAARSRPPCLPRARGASLRCPALAPPRTSTGDHDLAPTAPGNTRRGDALPSRRRPRGTSPRVAATPCPRAAAPVGAETSRPRASDVNRALPHRERRFLHRLG